MCVTPSGCGITVRPWPLGPRRPTLPTRRRCVRAPWRFNRFSSGTPRRLTRSGVSPTTCWGASRLRAVALRDGALPALGLPVERHRHPTSTSWPRSGRGCGSTAWVASLINVCAWLAALFPDRAQRDVWGAKPDAWIAGSLNPIGETTNVDGGWRVTGRWPWASGCLHAQWAACGINMKNGERADRQRRAVVACRCAS